MFIGIFIQKLPFFFQRQISSSMDSIKLIELSMNVKHRNLIKLLIQQNTSSPKYPNSHQKNA